MRVHALDEVLLDFRMAEVEEVPRVIPNEAVALDGTAIAADLLVGLEDETVLIAQPIGKRESAHAGAHH